MQYLLFQLPLWELELYKQVEGAVTGLALKVKSSQVAFILV